MQNLGQETGLIEPDHGWTQNGLVPLIVLSAEADDLTLAQLVPTIATTSNQ